MSNDLSPWRTSIAAELVGIHDEAVANGDDGYLDPTTGLFVFTDAYLLAKGPCCESRCRHCPYREWNDA